MAGESHSERPHLGGPADEEIVSVVPLQERMIELARLVKNRPVKMLLDSNAIDNFISDTVATALKFQVQEDEGFCELTLADGTVVPTAGYVQFVMNCGDYNSTIVVKVFPKLHKDHKLRTPWLEYKNPIID